VGQCWRDVLAAKEDIEAGVVMRDADVWRPVVDLAQQALVDIQIRERSASGSTVSVVSSGSHC
jgi:hypothetical protein